MFAKAALDRNQTVLRRNIIGGPCRRDNAELERWAQSVLAAKARNARNKIVNVDWIDLRCSWTEAVPIISETQLRRADLKRFEGAPPEGITRSGD